MQETQVQSLGWEDVLEEEMATHSSIPAGIIPWTEELGGLLSTGSQRVGTTEHTHSTPTSSHGEDCHPTSTQAREAKRGA